MLCFVALRTLLRMSLIFQRSLPAPLSSQKRSPTSQINTLFGFFRSSPRLNPSSFPCADAGLTVSSSVLWTNSCLKQSNCLYELEKEFYWRVLLGTKGCNRSSADVDSHRNHQHCHRRENTLTCAPTIIKLLPSITTGIPASFATTRIPPPPPLCLPCPASLLVLLFFLRHRDDKSIPEHLGHPPSQHVDLTD